jgi:hypothetical protein
MNQTTTTAATAGAAVGGIIAWGLSLVNGVDVPVEVGALFATVGAFGFGALFPGK